MRQGFYRLARLVQEVLGRDPFSGHVFGFCGKHGHLVKLWSAPRQTGHAAGVDDCWAMNSRGESMRKPLWGWTAL
jgi:hypothetical protein